MIDVSDLVGVPFKVHGRSKEEGFDCYGLAMGVERRAGKNLPDAFYSEVKAESNRKVRDVLLDGVFDWHRASSCERLAVKGTGCLPMLTT